jgi:light-regulated signal transduction histidine kinase (bacteriophytochrome)
LRWLIEENVEVRADKELMRIALQNLLDNAWKFTSKTPDAAIRIGARERDGRQVCFVADNGAGFDMAYADKLFGAFQRLHHADEFPGTGIGLAIVQRIVARHGGTIWAESKVGGGATFFFTLGESKNDERGQDNPAG